jgi:hypothetical protein
MNKGTPVMNRRRRPSRSAAPSSEQPQAAEGERAGAQHPLRVLLGEAEVGSNRGQGHEHDRAVEDQHEEGAAEGARVPTSNGDRMYSVRRLHCVLPT